MVHQPKSAIPLVPRLGEMLAALLLLGCPTIGHAAGTWSVISLPQKPGEVVSPKALAAGAAGNVYVAEQSKNGPIQERDARGNWSVIATQGASALAVDTAGDLYVAGDTIEKRDVQGNWSQIAAQGYDLGQVNGPAALAVDTAGNLYVADLGPFGSSDRIQKRDAQGSWSVIATRGTDLGQVSAPSALAVGAAGSLYVADGAMAAEFRSGTPRGTGPPLHRREPAISRSMARATSSRTSAGRSRNGMLRGIGR